MRAWLALPPGVTAEELADAQDVLLAEGFTPVSPTMNVGEVMGCDVVVILPGYERSSYWYVVEAIANAAHVRIMPFDDVRPITLAAG